MGLTIWNAVRIFHHLIVVSFGVYFFFVHLILVVVINSHTYTHTDTMIQTMKNVYEELACSLLCLEVCKIFF